MRMAVWMVAMMGADARGARGETVLARVLKPYDAVQSLSCEIRRDTPLPDGQTMRMLSRVYYQRPDRLHVENFSPVKRRIVSDGTVFRSYTEGAPQGFSRPVAELNEEMAAQFADGAGFGGQRAGSPVRRDRGAAGTHGGIPGSRRLRQREIFLRLEPGRAGTAGPFRNLWFRRR